MIRWLLALWFGVALAVALPSLADARPGGGHSFSSGGSHGSFSSHGSSYRGSSYHGGGSYGGGDAAVALAIVLGVLVLIVVIASSAQTNRSTAVAWTSANARPARRMDAAALISVDPAFSLPVFEDFVFQLYARARRARGAEVAALTPYFDPTVLAQFGAGAAAVVIGSIRVVNIRRDDARQWITLRIEANLAQPASTAHLVEQWTLARANGVSTRASDKVRTWPCPNCGAPFAAGNTPRTCAHCGAEMVTGKFDWTVVTATPVAFSPVGPTLTGTMPEVGNDLPTLVATDAYVTLQTLVAADPNVSWDAFVARTHMIYDLLNETWNAQDLTNVRGVVTSSLLAYLQFWIDEYKRQGLANKLTDAAISHVALAKVTRDTYYDAITVRVYASGFDYTVSANGTEVGGSRTSKRDYTEYWTFLRSANRKGAITTTPNCPNCGAPLAISDAGTCTHCNVEIESGSFDWVLSKIEQDEVYAG